MPERILIVRVGAMGDVLHAMPAVTALRNAFPQAEIGWVVEPRWASLLQAPDGTTPLVTRVHFASTKQWSKAPFSLSTLRSIAALRKELRSQKYDLAIDLQGSIRSAVIAKLSGTRRIVGGAHPREKQAAWFYTKRVVHTSAHVIDQAAEIVSAAAGQPIHPAPITLPIDPAADRWLRILLAGDPRPVAVIAPAAGWGAKQWPPERYGAVASLLAERGMRVLVNAIPAAVNNGSGDLLAALVVTASNNTAEAVECTLPQLTALLHRAKLFLGGDTGPLHLAAALGVSTVAIFGPTDPARNGPYGNRSAVLRDATSTTDHRRHGQAEEGLLRIDIADVTHAAITLLGDNG